VDGGNLEVGGIEERLRRQPSRLINNVLPTCSFPAHTNPNSFEIDLRRSGGVRLLLNGRLCYDQIGTVRGRRNPPFGSHHNPLFGPHFEAPPQNSQ
jgi:hypothetical protein